MLTDQSLPPHIASGLRAVASLLSTRSSSISYKPKIDFINHFSFKNFSSSLEEKETPYSANTPNYISEVKCHNSAFKSFTSSYFITYLLCSSFSSLFIVGRGQEVYLQVYFVVCQQQLGVRLLQPQDCHT